MYWYRGGHTVRSRMIGTIDENEQKRLYKMNKTGKELWENYKLLSYTIIKNCIFFLLGNSI